MDDLRTVLVVDDDPDIRLVLRTALEGAGYEVRTAESARDALTSVAAQGLPHLAVLDILMPVVDGLELARELRSFSDVPVILLSALDQPETIVSAIHELAEDYVTKPFHPEELLARVHRVLLRIGDFGYAAHPVTPIDQRLSVDFGRRLALVEDEEVSLTPTESKLLHILVRGAGRPVTTGYLLGRVWPRDEVYEDTLRVHVHRLRRKIEVDPTRPAYVVTERGLGYRFGDLSGSGRYEVV